MVGVITANLNTHPMSVLQSAPNGALPLPSFSLKQDERNYSVFTMPARVPKQRGSPRDGSKSPAVTGRRIGFYWQNERDQRSHSPHLKAPFGSRLASIISLMGPGILLAIA